MTILKKGFLFAIVAHLCLFVLNPLVVTSSEEAVPASGEAPSPEVREHSSENQPLMPAQERANADASQSQQTSASSPFFSSALSQVITPGHVNLDQNTLDQVYDYQLNRGIKNFTAFTAFLLVRSQKALDNNQVAEAVRLAKAAKKMAPIYPEPLWAVARAYRAESISNLFLSIRETLGGYAVSFSNFRNLLVLAGNSFFILFLAFASTLLVFASVLLIKYFRVLVHDLSGFAGAQDSQIPGYILATALVLLPVLLALGFVIISCWWLLVLAVYFTKKEKHVVMVFFLILILLPWSFRNGASIILGHQAGIVDELCRANNEDWTPETEKTLKAYLSNNPDDTAVLFTLALIKKREGNYVESEGYYNAVLRLHPFHVRAMGNLGNIYLAKGQLERAEEIYKKAIEANPKIAALHYNLYRTYLELYKFLEAQKKQELLIATRLDPALIEHQERILNPTIANRMTIDQNLSLAELWDITLRESREREELANILWELFFMGVPLKYGTFVFVVLCFCISFIFFYDLQKRFSTLCHKCGRPMRRSRRMRPEYLAEICQPCIAIFIDEEKGDLRMREERIKRAERHQARQDVMWRVLTYVLPGAGHLWTGFPGLSALLVLIFFAFVLKIVFWNGLLRSNLAVFLAQSFLALTLFIVVFLGYYLCAVSDSRKRRAGAANLIQSLKILRTQGKEPQTENKDEGKAESPIKDDWQQP